MNTSTLNLTAARVTRPAVGDRFNAAMNRVVKAYDHQQHLLQRSENDDHRLRWLWARTNEVSCDVNDFGLPEITDLVHANFQNDLAALAAFALAWLAGAGVPDSASRVRQERDRQRQLFREGKISFDVSSPIIDPARKFRVLAEEVGEVAHAIDQIENHDMAAGNLHLELIQVAAVAVAWLESLEVQS
jgi:hypothetical protein